MTKDQDLGYRFLYYFSRFEFALKTTAFLEKGRGNVAQPNWDKFSQTINKHKVAEIVSKEFQKSAKYFFEYPPQKQVVTSENKLGWKKHETGNHDFEELLKLVRRVRNNFFHGGKYPFYFIEGSERNTDLLEHSLVILKECLNLDQNLKKSFFEKD